jgi:nucleoid-associated protein YgaU
VNELIKQIKKKRLVLKNKERFLLFTTILLLFFTGILLTAKAHSFKKTDYIRIKVCAGDTLWDIASDYQKNADIRRFIYDIKKLNKLPDSKIYEGQTLIIPDVE